jgi:hypothetical protein
MRYAIARTGGTVDKLATEDFVHAANGLRPQLDLMHGAKEGVTPDDLTTSMQRVVKKVITEGDVGVYDRDDQHRFTLGVTAE